MNKKISELFDYGDEIVVNDETDMMFDPTEIKEMTMKKIHEDHHSEVTPHTRNLLRRFIGIAVTACLVFALAMTSFAIISKWRGYADTEGLTQAEVESMLRQYSSCVSSKLIEPNGTVHYLDDRGNELMVLSAEDAAKYDTEIRQAQEQAVRESTDLIDIDSFGTIPNGISVVQVSKDGTFHDFVLGNGYMILLCAEEDKPYLLYEGDTVTIRFRANNECVMSFAVSQDGKVIDHTDIKAQNHHFSYVVPADGKYCFLLMYGSASASSFTDCSLVIEE